MKYPLDSLSEREYKYFTTKEKECFDYTQTIIKSETSLKNNESNAGGIIAGIVAGIVVITIVGVIIGNSK
jgi:hypothetical protein